MTLPNCWGEVCLKTESASAKSGGYFCLSSRICGEAKHSCTEMSTPLVCSIHHLFGKVSLL